METAFSELDCSTFFPDEDDILLVGTISKIMLFAEHLLTFKLNLFETDPIYQHFQMIAPTKK